MKIQKREMIHGRHSLFCIIPPYILDHLAKSGDPKTRELAVDAIANASAARAVRSTLAMLPSLAATPSPSAKKHRLVYDVKNGGFSDLPGDLVRSEGDPKSTDPAVN